MRIARQILITAAALLTLFPTAAADRATYLLERLSEGFRAMKSYEVRFEISAEDFSGNGSYTVDGDSYCLTLGDAEVFADATTRYEVDNRRREVTIVEVDRESRNLLNNPIRAFDFLDSQYTPTLVSEADGHAVVRLTPTTENSASAGTVEVTISTSTMRPESLDYDYDGERVTVRIVGIGTPQTPLRRFDPKQYDGYEMIDFR